VNEHALFCSFEREQTTISNQGKSEFLMKKSHFRIPFPYKKQAISWKFPDIIRRFTVNNVIFSYQNSNFIHLSHLKSKIIQASGQCAVYNGTLF